MVEIRRSSQFSDDLAKSVSELRNANDLIDVTLVSGDGKQFFAHRLILAASSPFFKSILTNSLSGQPHPILYMRGVSSLVLSWVLELFYQGKVAVPENEISDFLSFAKEININGLQENTVEREGTIVYLPGISPELESKISTVVETKVEFTSEVDKKLLHIFQPEEKSKHAVKREERTNVVGDLSQNSKWLQRVQSQKKFCNHCDYVTNGNSKLKRHKEVRHDMERRDPIVCKTTSCGESFKTSSGFKEHREKCFMTCPSNACNSKFTIPESLEIHRRKHELGEIKEHRFLLKKPENSEASLKRIWDGIQKTS